MKVITWNCNGAFRNKIDQIISENADLLIIQECENPEIVKYEERLLNEYKYYIWIGENKNKGLGVFSNNKLDRIKIDMTHHGRELKYFIPFIYNNKFKILAAWTHKNQCVAFQYIGQLFLLMEINKEFFHNTIIIGDLNSNSIWDEWDRWWNHSDYVRLLKNLNIESCYHKLNSENHGEESKPTFFHRKDKEKKYHIDYIFAPNDYIQNTKSFEILEFNNSLQYSDHMALEWDFYD
jgi:exonuclease III